MFDLDRFLADCLHAVQETGSHGPVRELVARAVASPGNVMTSLGEPARGGVTPLYQSNKLTVLNVVWGPLMNVPAHNHEMWAVIGVYTGREDSILWRRVEDEEGTTIEAAGARSLSCKCAESLGKDIVHSVVNPLERLTAAIHVYGGDFFAAERSEWDPETHEQRAYDFERTQRYFEQSNRLLTS